MDPFAQARTNMVESQVRPNDVTDYRIIAAMLAIPRERFVPAAKRAVAYIDEDIPLPTTGAARRFLMQPMYFAKLLHLADLKARDLVLDVGCATGYSTAVIAQIAESVVALEAGEALAQSANETLTDLEVGNAVVITGELAAGYPSEGPYDVIFVNGAVERIDPRLFEQLNDGGRLVCVDGASIPGTARLYTRHGDHVSSRAAFSAAVKPLPGFEKPKEFVF